MLAIAGSISFNIKCIIEGTVPIQTKKRKINCAPWMHNYCVKLVYTKYRQWKKYCHSQKCSDYMKYCEIRNKATPSVHFAKRKYETGISLEVKENLKLFSKFVTSKTQIKTGIGDLQDENGKIITNDMDKAESLNSFFSSVFTKNEDDSIPAYEAYIALSLTDIAVTPQRVKTSKVHKHF